MVDKKDLENTNIIDRYMMNDTDKFQKTITLIIISFLIPSLFFIFWLIYYVIYNIIKVWEQS